MCLYVKPEKGVKHLTVDQFRGSKDDPGGSRMLLRLEGRGQGAALPVNPAVSAHFGAG